MRTAFSGHGSVEDSSSSSSRKRTSYPHSTSDDGGVLTQTEDFKKKRLQRLFLILPDIYIMTCLHELTLMPQALSTGCLVIPSNEQTCVTLFRFFSSLQNVAVFFFFKASIRRRSDGTKNTHTQKKINKNPQSIWQIKCISED